MIFSHINNRALLVLHSPCKLFLRSALLVSNLTNLAVLPNTVLRLRLRPRTRLSLLAAHDFRLPMLYPRRAVQRPIPRTTPISCPERYIRQRHADFILSEEVEYLGRRCFVQVWEEVLVRSRQESTGNRLESAAAL
jgi:hypothetical protein